MRVLLINKTEDPLTLEYTVEKLIIPQLFGYVLDTISLSPYVLSVHTSYDNGQVHITCEADIEGVYTKYKASFSSINPNILRRLLEEFNKANTDFTSVDIEWDAYDSIYLYLTFLTIMTAKN